MWHSKTKLFCNRSLSFDGEKQILLGWTEGLVDRDNNMIYKFQHDFHSCFWEFYLYAILVDNGCKLNQTHHRPDFVVESPTRFYIEAVTSNVAAKARKEDSRDMYDILSMISPPYCQDDFNRVLDQAIVRCSNALESKRKALKEYERDAWYDITLPFTIALGSFSQVNYGREFVYSMRALLYGQYFDGRNMRYDLKSSIIKPETNSPIKLGLFCDTDYQDISAVIFSCTCTTGKLTSLAISQGKPSTNKVINIIQVIDENATPYKIRKVSPKNPEYLADGLFVFHNPFAKNPLPEDALQHPAISHFTVQDNQLNILAPYFFIARLNYDKRLDEQFGPYICQQMEFWNNYR